MAYVVGLITKEEELELKRRGWTTEEAPAELVPKDLPADDRRRMRMVWVDNSMFSIMDGPDWEKGSSGDQR